jgi:hypothetical protein
MELKKSLSPPLLFWQKINALFHCSPTKKAQKVLKPFAPF